MPTTLTDDSSKLDDDDIGLFGDDNILDDAVLAPPFDWISTHKSEEEAANAFNAAIESKGAELFSLYQSRHNDEQHPNLFRSCPDFWCRYAGGAAESPKRLFIGFEEKHESELHDADFDDCDDRWCRRVWTLIE